MFAQSKKRLFLCAVLSTLPHIVAMPARAAESPAEPVSRPSPSPRQSQLLSKAAEADARAADLSAKLDRHREAVRKIIGPDHVGSVDGPTGELESDEVRLEVDKAGLTVRRDSLADAVARLTADADKRARAAMVDASAAKLDRLKTLRKAGQASDGEVDAAAADYQAVVAQKAAAPPSAVDYETIASINRQLVDTSVTLAETVARLDFVPARLRSIDQARPPEPDPGHGPAQRRAKTDAATYREQAEQMN